MSSLELIIGQTVIDKISDMVKKKKREKKEAFSFTRGVTFRHLAKMEDELNRKERRKVRVNLTVIFYSSSLKRRRRKRKMK